MNRSGTNERHTGARRLPAVEADERCDAEHAGDEDQDGQGAAIHDSQGWYPNDIYPHALTTDVATAYRSAPAR